MSDAFSNWKALGITSSLGDELSMIYGESTTGVLGLQGTIVMGNKLDYIINPLTLLGESRAALQPVLGTILGRTQLLNCQQGVYQLGQTVTIALKNAPLTVQPLDSDVPLLEKLWHASNLCTALAIFWTVGAGKKITTDWATENRKLDEGLNVTFLSVTLALAIVVVILALLLAVGRIVAERQIKMVNQLAAADNLPAVENDEEFVSGMAEIIEEFEPLDI